MSELNQKFREETFRKVKRVVVKVGTSVLTHENGLINTSKIMNIAAQICSLKKRGYEIVLVSSAAIGAGMGELGLTSRPKTLPDLQAMASIGQVELMREYHKCFKEHGEYIAQILLINDDLKIRTRHINARNTVDRLLERGVIPIVNENDTVSVDEIKFGDNDILSALVANLVKADMLVVLSDVDGLIDYAAGKDNVISIVENVDESIEGLCIGKKSGLGTGGMKSKLRAVCIVNHGGEAAVIANGHNENILSDLFEGRDVGTVFLPKKGKMAGRKRWIAFFVNPSGSIKVDEGAEKALKTGGKSLLSSGIVEIRGLFRSGDMVSIVNGNEKEFGRGIVYYSSEELEKIKGMKTDKIAGALGRKKYDEVIHRDHMVIL